MTKKSEVNRNFSTTNKLLLLFLTKHIMNSLRFLHFLIVFFFHFPIEEFKKTKLTAMHEESNV